LIRNFLIVAGGIGSRMGNDIPKQFLLLCGKPVLLWTLERAKALMPNVQFVVVIPASEIEHWKSLCLDAGCQINHRVVVGGKSRFESVRNGLELVSDEEGLTAVHDGVRPFFTSSLIDRLEDTASHYGNAVPSLGVTDSIRMTTGSGNKAVDRSNLCIVQTPQVFKTNLLKHAYQKTVSGSYTDDASVVEAMGETIQLVEGEVDNIKITRPFDLVVAEVLIHNQLN